VLPPSIKAKVTLAVTVCFLVMLATFAAIQAYLVRNDIREMLGLQQLSLASHIADQIDQKLATTHQALIAVAKTMPPEIARDPARIRKNLEDRASLLSLFDSLFFVSATGVTLVDLPDLGRRGVSVTEREFFQLTMKDRKPHVSAPFLDRGLKQPIIVLTAPVLDRRGEVVAVLSGALDLLRPNFLGRIGAASVGNTGSFALLGRDRTIIVSRERDRIMTQGPAPGVSPYFDHAVAGHEGWEESTNMRALFGYAPLQTVPWVLVAALPTEEAYAPIVAAQKRTVMVLLTLVLVLVPVLWFSTQYLLGPLLALHETIRRMQGGAGKLPPALVGRKDEIGKLAADFDSLMQERSRAEAASRESEKQLSLALEGSQLALFDWNIESGEVFLSEQWAIMLGGKAELTRTTYEALAQLAHPDDQVVLAGTVRDVLKGVASHYRAEHRVRTNDGRWIWVQSHGQVTARGPDGQATRLVGTNADVTEKKSAAQVLEAQRAELERLAQYDALTGLPNRNLFNERVARALGRGRRSREPTALLYLDIDRFKAINDSLGHVPGDVVLSGFAARLVKCVRETDTVARLGGDEFVILLDSLRHPEDVQVVANKILEVMKADFQIGLNRIRVTTSIGIAFAAGTETPEDLLKRADAALYEAKGAGRNRFHIAPAIPGPNAAEGAAYRGLAQER
jgi:diguanylate cyclase (GGDEF)-like protein/PAS domain S-box-containing protein